MEVTYVLDATEPTALFGYGDDGCSTSVWLRMVSYTDWHWPEVAIRGEEADVLRFIALHWGDEMVEQIREDPQPWTLSYRESQARA